MKRNLIKNCNALAGLIIGLIALGMILLFGWWFFSNLTNIGIGLAMLMIPVVMAIVSAILIKKYLLK